MSEQNVFSSDVSETLDSTVVQDYQKIDVSQHPTLKGFEVRQFTSGQKAGQYQAGKKVSRRERRITYAYGNTLEEAYKNWQATSAIHLLRQTVIEVHSEVFKRNTIRDAANGNADPRLLLLANRFLSAASCEESED